MLRGNTAPWTGRIKFHMGAMSCSCRKVRGDVCNWGSHLPGQILFLTRRRFQYFRCLVGHIRANCGEAKDRSSLCFNCGARLSGARLSGAKLSGARPLSGLCVTRIDHRPDSTECSPFNKGITSRKGDTNTVSEDYRSIGSNKH
ncbi:hypothetical protein ALC53_10481 [Atta colombica]|uniref:Uncharacterized protein n=1 Tax=Atta colombica TaxID=520822 RepID=A0A195B3S9_9HYME|nr:hypothetical protein ALC53_10481 [Atta colombica]